VVPRRPPGLRPGGDGHAALNEKIKDHPRAAKVVKVAEQGFYPITHKVADVFLRRTMINALMRKHPQVQRLQREGMSTSTRRPSVSRDPAVRDRIQEQVNNALGDYHHLNPLEKRVATSSRSTPGTAPSCATASTWPRQARPHCGRGAGRADGHGETEQRSGTSPTS
jgi:hypothetical protein